MKNSRRFLETQCAGIETMFKTNADDADEDPDLDGLTNLQEYEQGYDPGSP